MERTFLKQLEDSAVEMIDSDANFTTLAILAKADDQVHVSMEGSGEDIAALLAHFVMNIEEEKLIKYILAGIKSGVQIRGINKLATDCGISTLTEEYINHLLKLTIEKNMGSFPNKSK